MSCTHCLKIGHVEDDRYRFIRYPKDFKFTNPKGYAVKGNAAAVTEEYEAMDHHYSDLDINNFTQ